MTDDWKVDGRREWERGRFKVEERSMRWKRAVRNEKKVMKIMDMIEKHFFQAQWCLGLQIVLYAKVLNYALFAFCLSPRQ